MATEAQELEREPTGVDEGVEHQQPDDSTAEPTTTRQPEKKKVNLDEFDEFRRWKAETDKRLNQERQERQRIEQRYQQQLEEQQRALRQKQLEGMDDYQRLQYERDEAAREAAYWREQAAHVQTQTARERELASIATKFGVPRDVLEEATSRAEALEMAWDYREQQQQEQARQQEAASAERQQAREQKRANNRVDTGKGTPITDDQERRYQELKRKGAPAKDLFAFALDSNRGR